MHRVAAIQMTSTDDRQANLKQAAELIQKAHQEGANLVVLPEMFAMMGVDQQTKLKYREKFGSGLIQDFLSEQSQKYQVWIVGGTLPIEGNDPKRAYAACLLYNSEGQCVARYDKIHLFDVIVTKDESYNESHVIEPGKHYCVHDTPFGKLGLAVCYDLRFPELFREMHRHQVEIVALPAAFTYKTGLAHWEILLRARAIENQIYMIAAAEEGEHPGGRVTFGHSMIIDPWGDIQAIREKGKGVIISEIHLDTLHKLRANFPVLHHKKM